MGIERLFERTKILISLAHSVQFNTHIMPESFDVNTIYSNVIHTWKLHT
jgi:5-formyltetrahydrofolate cyclo-ligase